MGQRSQIYIRINDKDGNILLFAKYFQWNFAERMISRARYGIEYLKRNIEYLNQDTVQERINKIFDVNFDMQDVALSTDILQEVRDDFWWNRESVNDYIFLDQDNNDGKLFIDCNQSSGEIKFCFTDYDMNILTPNEYMKWDMGNDWDSPSFYKELEQNKEWQEIISICRDNIKFINDNAKVMNEIELEQFIKSDYSKQIGESSFKIFLKNFIEKKMLYDDFRYFHIEKTDENGSWEFTRKNPKEICMKYDSNTKELIVENSFQKDYYERIIQDVYDYYGLQNRKTLLEVEEIENKIEIKAGTNLEEIGDRNETEINYDYE